jgi:anti-sigma factor RsiW
MNCSDIHELAPLFVCGELDAARAAEFDAHLKTCSSCLHEIEEQSRLDARLRQALLAEDVDVVGVNRRIRELMAAETLQPRVVSIERPRPAGKRWLTAALGIAAAFILVLAGYLALPGRFAKVYADAAEDHQNEVIDHSPRHWYADPAQIASLEQRLGVAWNVPEELAGGYHLEHGKICRLDGRLYLHLVYTDGTREFSLFLRPRDGERLTGRVRGFAHGRLIRSFASGDERLASFETSHLVAVVATNQDAASGVGFAQIASSAISD